MRLANLAVSHLTSEVVTLGGLPYPNKGMTERQNIGMVEIVGYFQ